MLKVRPIIISKITLYCSNNIMQPLEPLRPGPTPLSLKFSQSHILTQAKNQALCHNWSSKTTSMTFLTMKQNFGMRNQRKKLSNCSSQTSQVRAQKNYSLALKKNKARNQTSRDLSQAAPQNLLSPKNYQSHRNPTTRNQAFHQTKIMLLIKTS